MHTHTQGADKQNELKHDAKTILDYKTLSEMIQRAPVFPGESARARVTR